MCLGIPMRIIAVNGYSATCEAKGISRDVNLFLLQHEDLNIGDLVMVHVGNAIQKMSEDDAKLAWDTYDEIFELEKLAKEKSARENNTRENQRASNLKPDHA